MTQPIAQATEEPRSTRDEYGEPESGWRLRLYNMAFRDNTASGRYFTFVLMLLVIASVGVVVLDSIAGYHTAHAALFAQLEWVFTIIFTAEYVLRLVCVQRPWRYALSGFGLIDLLAILPTYLAFLAPGMASFLDIRVLRLARIFRVLKLTTHFGEYTAMTSAILSSRRKIMVFLSVVLLVALVMGTMMYVVEGPENGFTSIPVGLYWAITTMTTVGYGDIAPKTDLGRFISSIMMLLGWGTLAVPTGIVSAEFTAQRMGEEPTQHVRTCAACGTEIHGVMAKHCFNCGASLSEG